uniref:Putative secreted peptide n=1 Tax=Anopheles braziliensis TaxID=58242 RepID=A0A2M3ZNC4_9DIPT
MLSLLSRFEELSRFLLPSGLPLPLLLAPCSLGSVARSDSESPIPSPLGRSTKYNRMSDSEMIPITFSSSSTTTNRCTSARTMRSMIVKSVSSSLHRCTPSNHAFRCSFAFFSDTSRSLYVFSAARLMTSNLA